MKAIGQKHWIGRQYNSIDLCKFIMAFAVVAIHTLPFADVKNVVFRNIYDTFVGLAVPFFFLASGYLLAVKMDYPYGSEGDLHRIQKQLRGMLRLYLTWTVIYAPPGNLSFYCNRNTCYEGSSSLLSGLRFHWRSV
jgi:surface polysaccharide O-acyltransferase-like enzyme